MVAWRDEDHVRARGNLLGRQAMVVDRDRNRLAPGLGQNTRKTRIAGAFDHRLPPSPQQHLRGDPKRVLRPQS